MFLIARVERSFIIHCEAFWKVIKFKTRMFDCIIIIVVWVFNL